MHPILQGLMSIAPPGGEAKTRTLKAYDANASSYMATGPMDASIHDPRWVIEKFFYDDEFRLVDVQTLVGAWSNRETLDWQPQFSESDISLAQLSMILNG